VAVVAEAVAEVVAVPSAVPSRMVAKFVPEGAAVEEVCAVMQTYVPLL
tara:strand:+ start:144 stop:287 length:144 start_codon:yes stop_codon:yes gene_type:complete